MRDHMPRHGLGYLIAVLATAVMALLRYALSDLQGETAPTIPFVVPVILAAWYGGLRPGLLATALGLLAGNYLFTPARHSLGIESVAEAVALGLFLVGAVAISWLCESLHAARRRSEADRRRLELEIAERRWAEAVVVESEARFRAFMDNSPTTAFLKDGAGRYVFVNRYVERTSGRPAAEWVGKTDADLFSPADAERFSANDRKVLETGRAVEFEETVEDGHGRHDYLALKFPVEGKDGRRLLGGMAVDITEQRRAEREMARLLQRLTKLVDNSPLAVVEWDAGFVVTHWSGQAERLFGWAAAEVVGRRIDALGLVHAEDVPKVEAVMARMRDPANPFVVSRNRNNTKSGGVVSCEWYNSVLHDEGGRMVAVLSLVLDVTDRERAEAALRRAEERFRASQEASVFGFFILNAVRGDGGEVVDFEWEYANPVACGVVGRPAAELVGRRLLAELPDVRKKSDLFERHVRVVETGEPCDYELPYQTGGTERWFRNIAVKLGDGLAVSFADITERHRQVEVLRASEARFRQLAEAMPQIVWVADPAGRTEYLNHHWTVYTGRTTGEGLGEGWAESVHPADRPRVRALWGACVRGGTPFTAEFRLRGGGGEYRWQVARGVPVRDDGGRVVGWYGSSTDIDDPKRLAEALRDADRRKDEFLATLSHELRGPLAPIRNSVRYLQRHGPVEPAPKAACEMIDRQAGHMARLIDDLLDISRITLGKLDLRRGRVELASVIDQAVETARPYVESAGHELTVHLPPGPVYLNGDPARLAQVFANLLTNACKYTEKGGHIRLTAVREGGEVVVAVADDGIGIAPEFLPRLFEKFSQVAPALERSQGGLGIGLALVKGLVEMHGGDVTARSEGLGNGSEFVVRLPALTDGEAPSPRAAEPGADPAEGRATARHILVVDDNRDSADSLAMLLQLGGHEVQTAHDGLEAVDAAGRFLPDVVLMDIGMPKLNGYEACRRIRGQPWGKDMVLVALTGWGGEADRGRATEAGFDGHLVKPVELAALAHFLTNPGPVPACGRSGKRGGLRSRG